MATYNNTLELEPDSFSLDGYLEQETSRDLLRFSTAGSVDDGKSTLIGRLLYDTQSVYDDQVQSIQGKGTTAPGVLDLALLTDGLRAEREQGITIDVAYRYFSTTKRKFIIADTPGHEQYTRNMATGASTADLAIVLVDARKGVVTQSRRHSCITALLGVQSIVVAINKMDLVDYDEEVFKSIREEFTSFFDQLGELRPPNLFFVPVSALSGDNVVHPTIAMSWYSGPSLLQLLEAVPSVQSMATSAFRFPVQRVIRPDQDFRSFAGQIASGSIRPGDTIMVLPSRRTSRIRKIVTFDGDLAEAGAPQSISLTLEDELDISRGDLLVTPDSPADVSSSFTASLVWMDEQPLDQGRRYLLKHASRIVRAHIHSIDYRLDVSTFDRQKTDQLRMNDIGFVSIESSQPLALDRYTETRITGSFILIDPTTNATVAAGMIRNTVADDLPEKISSFVTKEHREQRWGHSAAHIHLQGPAEFAIAVERSLFLRGAFVVRLEEPSPIALRVLADAGALVITYEDSTRLAVTVDDSQSPLDGVEDLLHILTGRSILRGEDIQWLPH